MDFIRGMITFHILRKIQDLVLHIYLMMMALFVLFKDYLSLTIMMKTLEDYEKASGQLNSRNKSSFMVGKHDD